MSGKDRKIIILAQCLVNPYCRVHMLGHNFQVSHALINLLFQHRIGIIDYPCPETTAMGLMRNPQGRQQYDNMFFQSHCRELLKMTILMVKEFIKNRFKLVAYLGVENSPSCAVTWGKHKVNRYNTESPELDPEQDISNDARMGIMAEILFEELNKENIRIPFLEVPVKENIKSERMIKFRDILKNIIERSEYNV